VVSANEKRSVSREYQWNCICDCGNEAIRVGSSLRTGKTLSCGCNLNTEEANRKKGLAQRVSDAALKKRFRSYRDSAPKRKLGFDLSFEQTRELLLSPCFYCGGPPSQISKTLYETVLVGGIDRIDNSKGYTKENVVPCCKVCNYMKRALSHKEFLQHIEKISSFQKVGGDLFLQ